MSQSVVHKDKHMDVPATRSYHTIFEVHPPRGKNGKPGIHVRVLVNENVTSAFVWKLFIYNFVDQS